GLAKLLTGDALGPGGDLLLGEHGALVRLDVRAVRHTRLIAQLLYALDVVLHPVEIDHDGRGAKIIGDLRFQLRKAHNLTLDLIGADDSTMFTVAARGDTGGPTRAAAARAAKHRQQSVAAGLLRLSAPPCA